MKIERNAPCPCGSGKKFKKCHLGKEDALQFHENEEITEEGSRKITELPIVQYGRSQEILDGIDIKKLTDSDINIKCIDLKQYADLAFLGSKLPEENKAGGGSVFVNIYKTEKSDANNIYIALSPNVGDSILAHQFAHALDYIGGSKLMPGLGKPLSMEMEIPIEHLEHPQEYGYWLDYLQNKFSITLDADDVIISYLFKNKMLLSAKDIQEQNTEILKEQSKKMLAFLSKNSADLNELIRERTGYIGNQTIKD